MLQIRITCLFGSSLRSWNVDSKGLFGLNKCEWQRKGCENTIEAIWKTRNNKAEDVKVIKKVDKCGKELTKWSKNNFGNVRRELEKKRKLLAKAEHVAINEGSVHRIRQREKEINFLLDKEAKMWWQYNGWRMVTKTLGFFTVKLHKRDSEITSKDYLKVMGGGILSQPKL